MTDNIIDADGNVRSWPKIAAYIGVKNIKTARKYHTEFGMPILRAPSKTYNRGIPILVPELYVSWLAKANRKIAQKLLKLV